jgi:hypothetical protein
MAIVTMDMLLSQDYCAAGVNLPCTPNSLYARARQRARRGKFWATLTGRTQGLLSLKQIRTACTVEAKSDGGIRTVSIDHICGSEGRSRYFDRDFNPLYDQARGRWLSIVKARQQGKALPPVVLVQIGDTYFVQDGHHRISVARALGQTDLEAKVTVWQVAGSVPWEELEQPTYLRRAVDALRGASGRLRERLAQGVQVHRAKERVALG